jgi:hypothetical protein
MPTEEPRDYKLPSRVILHTAAVYLPTYKKTDDLGQFKAAETMLNKYNIGLSVWPTAGKKTTSNTLDLSVYEKPIKNTKEAYQQLRKDVNALLNGRAPGYPFIIPIVFAQFDTDGLAITPHSSKIGAATPLCIISMGAESMKDKMTILHEMGHAVEYPKYDHNGTAGNLMHESDGRNFLFKSQVENFGKAFFARTSQAT